LDSLVELVLAKLSIHENVCPRGALHSIQEATRSRRNKTEPLVRPASVGQGKN